MRIFLSVLFLIISLQSWTKADDITELEIEGFSIGDSLLDLFNEEEIKKFATTYYDKSDKFYILTDNTSKYEIYDSLQFTIKSNDKKKEIYGLGGIIWFEENINECLTIKKEIEVDLNLIFKNSKIEKYGERKLPYDTTGKSKQLSQTQYTINNGLVAIECTDFSDNMTSQMGYTDNLKIATYTKEYENFVRNEAY